MLPALRSILIISAATGAVLFAGGVAAADVPEPSPVTDVPTTPVDDAASDPFESDSVLLVEEPLVQIIGGERLGENPDGTWDGEAADGTRVGGTPDGTRVGGIPDGTRVGGTTDGTRVGSTPDGTRVGSTPDGTRVG